jgi:Bacterial Ig domain/Divergent InlB B-repeat domain/RTX calcium-binding nonapeptide repeat (4 copies)
LLVRRRPGLVGALAIAVALVAASASFGRTAAPNGSGCNPIVRTLENGDPAVTNGAVRVAVDGLGAFGRGAVAGGDAIFNPPSGFAPLGTTYTSNLYLSNAGRMLADDCVDGQVTLLSETPLMTRLQLGSLQLDVRQELDPVTLGGSTLRQTYTLTNNGASPISAHLVRHFDGDLRFDASTDDGAAASGPDGHTLMEFDSVSSSVPRVFVQITGALGSDQTPDGWTIQPFNYRPVIEGAQGIPAGDNGVVFNDTNGDLAVDNSYDVTLSQQWNATIPPSANVVLQSSTRFGAEDRSPTPADDSVRTGRNQPVDVDVRANDSDPDGDALAVESVTQPQHGSAAIQPDGTVRYTPADGFEGTDSFTYTVGDGRGGTATAAASVHVATYTLSATTTGNGRVTSAPQGIDCGTKCSADFVNGSTVTLVAHPDPGWTLGGWSGACTGTGACTVTMDAAKSVQADFLPPPPTPGSTANLALSSGSVTFTLPKSENSVQLEGAAQVPIGTEVDTTDGAAKVTVARGVTLDTSEFYDGDFTVLQPGPRSLGELKLQGGNFLDCVSSFRALAKKRPVRRLWGSGKGHFRTRGRYSSATVRGTKWLTEDLCDSTRITVVQGIVLVHDFVRDVDVSVKAGRSYRANALPRGVRNAGCTIVGTDERDFLHGTPGRNVICGLGGDDVIFGMGGDDRLIGGPGDDRLLGGPGDDLLIGNAGKDFLKGGLGHDVLEGGDGDDFMAAHDGGRGNDRLTGDGGRDLCYTDWVRVCP